MHDACGLGVISRSASPQDTPTSRDDAVPAVHGHRLADHHGGQRAHQEEDDVRHVLRLGEAARRGLDLAVADDVVAVGEVLQGIRSDTDYLKTKDYLDDLIYLPMRQATFVHAVDIYRTLRKSGITIRKPVDCMIASVAIENNTQLLHNDRDFNQIAKHTKLRIYG